MLCCESNKIDLEKTGITSRKSSDLRERGNSCAEDGTDRRVKGRRVGDSG